MSTGSKVVLLLTFIFIAFLIWHYGPAPAATQADIEPAALAIDEPDSTPAPAEPIPARPSTAIATAAPAAALPPRLAPLGTTARLQSPPVETATTLVMGQPRFPVAATPTQAVATNFRPVPSPVPSTVQRPKPAVSRHHVVVNGDTLSGISLRYYGNEYSWNIIVSANPGVDPDRLRIGHRLAIPERTRQASTSGSNAPAARPPVIQPGHKRHRVQDGESLSTISSQYYGRETWWIHIFEANKGTLKNDPDRLKIGMVLSIPGRQLITD